MAFKNKGLICIPEVFISCNVRGHGFMTQVIYELIDTKTANL